MKKVYFMLLGVLLSTAVMADNKQTVTIDGSQVSKTVKEITFDGDNVKLLLMPMVLMRLRTCRL